MRPSGAAVGGFCPNCGTQIGEPKFHDAPDTPESLLREAPGGPVSILPAAPPTIGGPGYDDLRTISPNEVLTSLDSPSPRPPIRPGDGPFQAGQQIGPRYTILKLLGTGGMGAVYQAFDHELGVAVAIKVIRPSAQSDATSAKELEQRFKRELVLARQVTHKYVVRIHDLGEIDGIKYLTMPFVEGETLAQILRRTSTLPLARVITIAQQIAHGLAAAHEKGVVHRDLKPENIMIERAADDPIPNSGDALIMDFGIARSIEGGGTQQTAAGSVIGTLEYMAPEQAQGMKVDQRADQYAFGLIVYDMLVGRQRFAARDNAMTELLSRISTAPISPRSLNPEIPEALDRLVTKCLQPSPDARFASTAALVDALDHLTPDGQVRTDVHEVIVHDTTPRPKWQLALAALLILSLTGTTGWLLYNRGGSAPAGAVARDPVSVLIGDFENKTGDPVFDGVVEQALSLGIEGASFVNSFPRRDALRAAAAIRPGARLDEQTARLVALRENLGMVIVGSIESSGAGYHIIIRGVGPGDDGAVKYTLDADASSKAAVLETVGALAAQVRAALGDTVAPAANDAFTAANLEAVREYVRAQELLAAGTPTPPFRSISEAAKLDPDFGRAWSGAATAARNLGRREEATTYYENALSKIDRMTDREKLRTRGQYYLFTGNSTKAIEENEALVKRYPSDSVGLSNLGFAYFQGRQFAKASEMQTRSVALQPNNVPRLNNGALYALYAGRFDDAMARARKANELNKDYGPAWIVQGLSAAALGQYDAAGAAFTAALALPGAKASAALGIADLAMLRGRPTDAAAALEPLLTDKLPAVSQARIHTTLAGVRLAQGRAADAAKLAESALQISPDGINRFEAARILLAADRGPRARQHRRRARQGALTGNASPRPDTGGRNPAGHIKRCARRDRRVSTGAQARGCVADSLPARTRLSDRRTVHRGHFRVRRLSESQGRGDGRSPGRRPDVADDCAGLLLPGRGAYRAQEHRRRCRGLQDIRRIQGSQ